jgi:hypothetical protein
MKVYQIDQYSIIYTYRCQGWSGPLLYPSVKSKEARLSIKIAEKQRPVGKVSKPQAFPQTVVSNIGS